ncbi:flippase-like domain-containing protein [Halanaerobium sp. Z-7514]|uniref:Phosphatidylglycerol lysyltransferase n=1 Tax=Halanaerobium polyolivorans TaxID=2886943 RepID=A0AAW4WWV3_9FIRM|nr:lysylphosphatidylglycerol synthase transmembrane domain-containing protein [Halanaerobium polyolivorans]MCC3144371.1 flippase-like domain-containing protein [Halanaerobium polyolivorans]RQD75330.1 MAG: UPF0104 family protein [Halanaerobium sp. MSAO_Bac5]
MKVIKYSFAILILTFLSFTIWQGRTEIVNIFNQISYKLIAALILLQISTIILIAYQWKILFKFSGQNKAKFSHILNINLASSFIESITPSAKLGGESAKVYLYNKITGIEVSDFISYIAVQKFATFLPFLLFAFILFIYNKNFLIQEININFNYNILLYSLIFFGLAIAAYFSLSANLKHKMITCKDKIKAIINQSFNLCTFKELLLLISIAALFWLLYPVKTYIIANYLAYDISPFVIITATFLAYLIALLPVSPGGLGSFEAVMALILTQADISYTEGLTIALILRFATFWFPLLLSSLASINLSRYLFFNKKESLI